MFVNFVCKLIRSEINSNTPAPRLTSYCSPLKWAAPSCRDPDIKREKQGCFSWLPLLLDVECIYPVTATAVVNLFLSWNLHSIVFPCAQKIRGSLEILFRNPWGSRPGNWVLCFSIMLTAIVGLSQPYSEFFLFCLSILSGLLLERTLAKMGSLKQYWP